MVQNVKAKGLVLPLIVILTIAFLAAKTNSLPSLFGLLGQPEDKQRYGMQGSKGHRNNGCHNNTNPTNCTFTPPLCGCQNISAPVCGTNGVTYNNLCYLLCANATLASQGACIPVGCGCNNNIALVCGSDGNTYSNLCQLLCAGVTLVSQGACPIVGSGNCGCSSINEPVCATKQPPVSRRNKH